MNFERRLRKAIYALYDLNYHYGNFLDDGLEDKVDQIQNLLDKQLRDIKEQM